jgi:glycosyltransferase involved in cell wall biosynthesis
VRPLRALHVVAHLDRGGIENWLVQLARRVDPARVRMEFLVQTERPGEHEGALRHLGIRVLRCPSPRHPLRYARALLRLLEANGPYDIVHSHLFTWSGLVLRIAAKAGVPCRLAHSHTVAPAGNGVPPLLWPAYAALMRRWIRRYATCGLAASRAASEALFGPASRNHLRREVLPCGIDLDPFARPVDRASLRRQLGIAEQAIVVGHVGRFVASKNHAFLLEIARYLLAREPSSVLLLVGDGPLRGAVEAQARKVSDRIVFAGSIGDVPAMLGAMDVFVFPSRFEGLGLAAVEAQAAGLPTVVADHLPRELEVVPPLVRRVSLDEPHAAWADVALRCARGPRPVEAHEALRLVAASPFNITRIAETLSRLYESLALDPGGPTETGRHGSR